MADPIIVLAIDDDPDVQDILKIICEGAGFEYHTAASGAAGLEMLEKLTPSAILMDVKMPDMNGFETADNIRDAFPKSNIPIIFLTASRDTATVEATLGRGASYLLKPVEPKRLAAKIKEAINRANQSG